MRSLPFDALFAVLAAVPLPIADLARLRVWLAGVNHPGKCAALIERLYTGCRVSIPIVSDRTHAAATCQLPVLTLDVLLKSTLGKLYFGKLTNFVTSEPF